MKSIIAVSILLFAVTAQGQTLEAAGTHVVMPSPNSWSAANEGNVDVDLYTGRLNYSIPLYVLKSRNLQVPITLQYSSDGVKVDDLASDVGLGWQLNAGGVIARVMRGLPDEFNGQYTLKPGLDVPAKGFLDASVRDWTDPDFFNAQTLENRNQTIENSNKTGRYVGSSSAAWDTEPDEFYFNFDRYSGKFVFDRYGNIQIIPRQNLLIIKDETPNVYPYNEVGASMITSFQVTDDRGIKYTFGNVDPINPGQMTAIDVTKYTTAAATFHLGYIYNQTGVIGNKQVHLFASTPTLMTVSGAADWMYSEIANKQTFTSSWHLIKIESPTGDYIDLEYANDEIKYITGRSHDISQMNLDNYYNTQTGVGYFGTYAQDDVPPSQNGGFYYQPQDFVVSTSKSTIQSKKLSSITAATGERVTVNSTIAREDLVGGKRIESLSIWNHSNQWIKTFQFKYGHTFSPWEDYFYEFKIACGNGINWPHDCQQQGFIFNTVDATQPDWGAMKTKDHARMFLVGVSELFPGTSPQDLISLEYEANYVLPARFSSQQDMYGYFNDNQAGHTLQSVYYGDSENVNTQVPVVFASLYINGNQLVMRPQTVNVNPSATKGKTGLLKNIIHKNGSKSTIAYSQSQGFRVSSISMYPDKDGLDVETTSYNYSSGSSANIPFEYLAAYPLKTLGYQSFRRNLTISSSPVNTSRNTTKGGLIGYAYVEKIRSGIGKEIFEFRTSSDTYYETYTTSGLHLTPAGNYFPYAPRNSFDHRRGQLKKRTVQNLVGNKNLLIETYNYSVNPSGFVPQKIYGLRPGKYVVDNLPWYAASFYYYQADWVFLDYTETTVYDQLDETKSATTTTHYFYNRPGESEPVSADLLARKTSTTLPNGDVIVNETKYPLDYTSTSASSDVMANGIHLLKSKKMESLPIESMSYLEKTEGTVITKYLLNGSLLKFKEFQAGKVYPWESYKLKVGSGKIFTSYPWSTITTVGSTKTFTWDNSSSFKFAGSIDSYDSYGNPLSQTGEDGIQSAYTWGYNNSLLTSVIQNSGSYQHQTGYTHSPLIGITQVTDPNLRNKNYGYDRNNRLKIESDHDNQILARYRYHFQNQIEGFSNTTISQSGCHMAGQPITFSSSENVELGQTIYNWNFGNGSTQSTTSTTAIYIYPLAGTYTVALTKNNPEYQSQSIQTSAVVYRPIGNVYSSVTGPITYDVCTITPPAQSTTLFVNFAMNGHAPADAFNVVWEYKLNSGPWTQMSVETGPISSTSKLAPSGFGNATITGTWTVRCTGQDACGNTYTKSFTLQNVASDPQCSTH